MMSFIFYLLSFLWALSIAKSVLFWIYLWQLKEYHIGRFIDHFRTSKGQKLISGFFPSAKFVLLALLFINAEFLNMVIYGLIFLYAVDFALIFKNKPKRPVVTFKTVFLLSVSVAVVMTYFSLIYYSAILQFWLVVFLLLFDFFMPLIMSGVVLLCQPFFVLIRMGILRKAKNKMVEFSSPLSDLTVIGITGSYGKTSTKEFLKTILSSKFNVLATPEHKNSEIGIAQTVLNDLNKDHEIFIVEMGAYKKGGINFLCDITKPHIGIVTGVNEQHLSTFGSMDNLLSAEGGVELLNNLSEDGLIVVNGDNKYCLDLYKKNLKEKKTRGKIYTVKRDIVDSDVWTEDVVVKKNKISFVAMSKEREMAHFDVGVLGRQNIQNLLAAILVAKEFGMSLEEIVQACKDIKSEQAGITLNNGIHGIHVIDSSYSSNPDGVAADLDYLNIFEGKKVIVMPCLIELGNKSSEVHYQIGKKIAEICDMAIITTKDRFKEVERGAIENGMEKNKIIFSEKPKEIFHLITTFCKEGDAVLLEGRVPSEVIRLLIQKS